MSVLRQDEGAGKKARHTNRRPPEQKVVGSNPVEGTTHAPVSRVETGASSFLPRARIARSQRSYPSHRIVTGLT